ncbi:hypothetical protein BGZ67_005575 [Mortierella alpina]|nr:hypothetical protein BGZ67_005575 [Mortierella alpina]
MEHKNPDPGPPPLRTSLPRPTHDADDATLSTRRDASGSSQHSSHEQSDQPLDLPMSSALNSQQPSSSGCTNTPDSVFAWQRLPQEALDQIAYNSRKQRNDRLKASPPVCAYCPAKRFTSMAMLSTHWRSKFHLAQVQKQEGTLPATKAHAVSVEPQADNPSTQQDVVMRNPDDAGKNSTDTFTAGSSNGSDAGADKAASPCSEHGTAVKNAVAGQCKLTGKQTTKQRKRKLERDRKRTRARMDLLSKITNLPRSEVEEPSVKVVVDNGHLDNIATPQNDPSDVGTTSSQLVELQMNHPVESEASGSLVTPTAATTREENITLSQTMQHKQWRCSLCKTVWKRQKAWQGHLLSAQHMRHLLRAMQEITPSVRPTGKLDVMASMDPFGWGTGVGAVEEEEEDDEEEEGEDQNRDMVESGATQGQPRINMLPKDGKNTRHSNVSEDDDDMDLGE